MSTEQQSPTGLRSKAGYDVANGRAGDKPRPLEIIACKLVADDRLQADLSESGNQSRANLVVGCAVGRMWPLVAKDEHETRLRPTCVELAWAAVDRRDG